MFSSFLNRQRPCQILEQNFVICYRLPFQRMVTCTVAPVRTTSLIITGFFCNELSVTLGLWTWSKAPCFESGPVWSSTVTTMRTGQQFSSRRIIWYRDQCFLNSHTLCLHVSFFCGRREWDAVWQSERLAVLPFCYFLCFYRVDAVQPTFTMVPLFRWPKPLFHVLWLKHTASPFLSTRVCIQKRAMRKSQDYLWTL